MRETVPHYMPLVETHGGSPGNGISAPLFSEDPMAFEDEFYHDMDLERRMTDRTLPRERPRRTYSDDIETTPPATRNLFW